MKKPATGVIQIWLSGGPATIDMWDLKPDAPEEIRGEFRPIATAAPGVTICEHMPGLAKVMDRCTLVRSLGHSISAHGPGTIYMATGNRPGPSLEYPAAGSLAARLLPPRKGVPPYVTFAALRDGAPGIGPGYLGPAYGPFEVEGDPARGDPPVPRGVAPGGVHARDLESREALRDRFDRGLRALDSAEVMAGLDRFHRQAAEILLSDRVRAALDLSREPAAWRDDYGRTPLGQGVLAARRLIEAGARFVTLGFGGWDTHGDNFAPPQEPPPAPAGQSDLDPDPRPGVSRAAGRDDRRLRRGVRPDPAGQRHGRARPLVACRWPCSWPAAGSPVESPTGPPTTAGRPRRATPVPPTTWPPRCSSGWASAPGTKSARPAGGRSRSSARGDAWRPWWVERLPGAVGRMTTGLGQLWPPRGNQGPRHSPPTIPPRMRPSVGRWHRRPHSPATAPRSGRR